MFTTKYTQEPYRLFFPLGTLCFLIGVFLWLPQIWNPGSYPVVLHRFLLLNGFTAFFIAGFLMTAVPKFSQTFPTRFFEVALFVIIFLIGLFFAYVENEKYVFLISSCEALWILFFLFSRISKRKQNPPYSFIFIFVGLYLWAFSAIASMFSEPEIWKRLHYEGAIAAIILGVGSRLIPGILGHVEIVNTQRAQYEKTVPIFRTVPKEFLFMMLAFVASYFENEQIGNWMRAGVVFVVSMRYWLLWKLPVERTTLTKCIWISAWLILISFVLRAFWSEGMIHASHAFFINGIALMSFLIATRVLQSHGPKDKSLENSKILYVVTGLIFVSSATRVTAFLMPEHYLSHLGYSALLLGIAVLVWAFKYLKYSKISVGSA